MDRIYFVTNRVVVDEHAAPWFGADVAKSPSDLRIGYADYDLDHGPPTRKGDVFVSPESKQTSTHTATGQRIAPDFSLFDELKGKMAAGVPDTILFIPGFDYTFEEALVGAGLLSQRLELGKFGPANMIVFSWPSVGETIPEVSYYDDRGNARDSGEAGGRALLQLWSYLGKLTKRDMCGGRIHIVAHSLGNYVLRNAIQALVNYVPTPPPTIFEQILLLAADEDYDALELDYKLSPLSHLSKRIHVYYNQNDIALDISVDTKGNPRRLGSRGPRNSSMIPDSVILLDAADISRESDGDKYHHHYYLYSPEMAPDMAQSLQGVAEDKIAGRIPLPGRSGSFRLKTFKKKT